MLIAECWLVYVSLGGLPHKCWLIHSPVSLVVGSSAFSTVDLTNLQLQCDSIILPTCHMKELDLDGLACHEFELQHGVCLIILSWTFCSWAEKPGIRGWWGMGWRGGRWQCSWSQETRVWFPLSSDEEETLAVHLTPRATTSSFEKQGHWSRSSACFFLMIQFYQF